jgi:hypothetical protein
MFGYVTPLKGELKVREYDVFKSYYCGLCREIGEKSYISKLTLTYDMTFLGLLLSSIYNDSEGTHKMFCPFKMGKVMTISKNPFLEYAAEMNILLSNRKLMDDYRDDRNYLKLIASKIININKLQHTSKEKLEKIDHYLMELNKLEKNRSGNIDEIGGYFGEVTSEIFNVYDDSNSSILKFLGYNMGLWIYVLDAYDDLLEDIKDKKYNPLIYRFEYNGENPIEFKAEIKDNINFTLVKALSELSKAFELLNIKKNKGLLENIIYMGMERKTRDVIEGSCCNEKSIRNFGSKGRCFPGGSEAGL